MSDRPGFQRTFVVGVPRSGTTLLQGFLAAHPALVSFTESHFFSRHFRAFCAGRIHAVTRDPMPRVRAFLVENRIAEPDVAAELDAIATLSRALPGRWFRGARIAGRLLELLDSSARLMGGAAWVEKTPMHLRFVRLLARFDSAARPVAFVHLVRDGASVVASLRSASEKWLRSYGIEECISRWNRDVALSIEHCRTDPTRHFMVCYEQLVRAPRAVLAALFERLGYDFEPAVLDRRADAVGALVAPGETWKGGVHGEIRSDRRPPELTDAEREMVGRRLQAPLYEAALRLACGRSEEPVTRG